MIVACPSCTTAFQVNDSDIGSTGRKVRCGQCGYTWFQAALSAAPPPPEPPTPEPAREAAAAPAPSPPDVEPGPPPERLFDPIDEATEDPESEPSAVLEETLDDAGEPDEEPAAEIDDTQQFDDERDDELEATDDEPFEIDEPPVFPIIHTQPRDAAWVGWTVLAAFVLLTVAGVASFRDTIVDMWPQARKLYVTLGLPLYDPAAGFEIVNLKGARDGAGLIIEGEIVNRSREVKPIPPVRVIVRDQADSDIFDWTFNAANGDVIPNEIVAFETRYDDLPQDADDAKGAMLVFDRTEADPQAGGSIPAQ